MSVPVELCAAGLSYPESPRWHNGRLWVSDVHAFAVKSIGRAGDTRVEVDLPGRPAGLGFLPDGRLLIAGALDRRLWAWDGTRLDLVADLARWTSGLLNDMAVDSRGRAFIGDTGFNLMAGEPARAGRVLLVDATTAIPHPRVLADDVCFPNGAAISDDGRRYWLCETIAQRVSVFDLDADAVPTARRVLIELPDLCDGLCLDANGSVWVALLRRGEFWHVTASGEVDRVVAADGRLAVACVLGGSTRTDLYLCSADTTMNELAQGRSRGLIHVLPVPVPGAGRP